MATLKEVYELLKQKQKDDEDYARLNKKGLWSMKFIFPWDYRRNN